MTLMPNAPLPDHSLTSISTNRDVVYANHYGRARLIPVTDYVALDALPKSADILDECFFSVEDAERLTLITNNYGIQCALSTQRRAFYVVHHSGPSTAALCRMVIEHFECSQSPQAEIQSNLNTRFDRL